MKSALPLILGLSLVLALDAPGSAQEWTRFRGPNGSGIGRGENIPAKWSQDDYLWKIALPGEGHGAPVIWGKRLFLNAERDEGRTRIVLCIDTGDGSTLWSREFAAGSHRKHRNNSFASSTPAVDEHHVYVAWAVPERITLKALDHDGNEVWDADLGPFKGGHGFAASPIVYEDLVVIGNDQDGRSSLVAVDRMTGAIRWKVPRRSKRTTYSTPCVFDPQGREPELIFTNWQHGITAVDPQTGRTQWEKAVFLLSRPERAIGSPVVAGDLVIGTCGFVTAEKHVVAVRPGPSGRPDDVEELWRVERNVPHVPTILVHENCVFLWTDNGIASCLDVETGEEIWARRIGGRYFGSPVCVNDRLYCTSTDGEVVVLAASNEYRLLARNRLGEGSHSTPAVSGGTMFIRTFSHLIAVGTPDAAE